MRVTITRLGNIPSGGATGIEAICTASDLPCDQTKYLMGTATELEVSG